MLRHRLAPSGPLRARAAQSGQLSRLELLLDQSALKPESIPVQTLQAPRSTADLSRFVEQLSLQVEQRARLTPEQLQAREYELKWRRARLERSSTLTGPWEKWGPVPALGVIVLSIYAANQGFLGQRELWWVLAAAVALQLCATFYGMHLRDQLELELQLVEFARRRQADRGE